MTDRRPPIGLAVEDIARDQDHHTLGLSGELDIASVPLLEAAVERACAETTKSLTLDLSELMFIDSTGLAAIVLTSKRCERDGHDFSLIRGPAAVQRLFELTGLVDALPFRDTSEPAAQPDGHAPPA